MIDLEAVVWCPKCRHDKYEIRRVPTGSEGSYRHVTYPESLPPEARKFCLCGCVLERKR